MIQAAVLDLDGTIIGPNQEISAAVAQAVGGIAELLPVSIATGREPQDVLRYSRQLGLTSPQICDGGATILSPATGDVMWTDPLSSPNSEIIVRYLDRMGANFIATHPGGSLRSLSQVPHWELTRISALDLDEATADRLVTAFGSKDGLHVVKAMLPYNGKWAVDFTHAGVDKAASL